MSDGETVGRREWMRNANKVLFVKARYILKALGVNWRILLNWIFKIGK